MIMRVCIPGGGHVNEHAPASLRPVLTVLFQLHALWRLQVQYPVCLVRVCVYVCPVTGCGYDYACVYTRRRARKRARSCLFTSRVDCAVSTSRPLEIAGTVS